jgi:hypothetical protein
MWPSALVDVVLIVPFVVVELISPVHL